MSDLEFTKNSHLEFQISLMSGDELLMNLSIFKPPLHNKLYLEIIRIDQSCTDSDFSRFNIFCQKVSSRVGLIGI